MTLKEQLPNVLRFFELSSEEKINNFQGALNESMQFSKQLKEVLASGSDEEKDEAYEILDEFKQRIQTEMNTLCETLGLSEEELRSNLLKPENFLPEHWESFQNVTSQFENTTDKPKKAKKIKKLKRTDWVQS